MNKQELKQKIGELSNELRVIERDERIKNRSKYIGLFFRYRNSYSVPQPDEYFWFYYAVTGVNEFGELIGWSFEQDYMGKITIEADYRPSEIVIDVSKKITKRQFYSAYKNILKEINRK